MNKPAPTHRVLDSARRALEAEGMRLTPQRRKILALFEGLEGHWTAQDVFSACEELSLATVYNTLVLFENLGLLRRFTSPDGVTIFHRNTDAHHHAKCSVCGSLLDIPDDRCIERLTQSAATAASFAATHASVWLHGTCTSCREPS